MINFRSVSFESPLASGFSSLVMEEILTASSSDWHDSLSEIYVFLFTFLISMKKWNVRMG